MRPVLLASAAVLLAGPAAAEWVYRSPRASDDLGSVHVDNAQGQRLNVGCGNGGFISVSLAPGARLPSGGAAAQIAFRIDGGAPIPMPVECFEQGCVSAPGWAIPDMRALTGALRRGSSVMVTSGAATLANFTLAGSSAAFRQFSAGLSSGCDGL